MGTQTLDELLDETLELEERIEADEENDEPDHSARAVAETAEPSEEAEPHAPASEYPDPEAPELVQEAAGFPSIAGIRGVPLWWERIPPAGPRRFPVAPDFIPLLEHTVRLVQNRSPRSFGKLTRIVTAGIFVAKGGAHEAGHA